MCSSLGLADPLTASSLSGGILVSTLTPFDDYGAVFCDPITDQARRIAAIDGVLGIAVNTTIRERETLSLKEQLDVIKCTAKGLKTDQLLLACVGELSEDSLDEV